MTPRLLPGTNLPRTCIASQFAMHNQKNAKQNHSSVTPYLQREGHWANVMLQALLAPGPLYTPPPPPFSADIELKKPPLSCSQVHGPASVHRPTIRQLAYLTTKTKQPSKEQGALGIVHICSWMVGVEWSKCRRAPGLSRQ